MTERRFGLTVMGTTDLHGYGLNWDYFAGAEYRDGGRNHVGLAKVASLVHRVRGQAAQPPARGTLLIDAGDTIQGTPLTYYYAKIEPVTGGAKHPMATAMNAIGFDAAAVGNHEFNYGIPVLRAFAEQLDFPLLAANAVDWRTGDPAFEPYVLRTFDPGVPGAGAVTVGVLGLTNPGIAIWDRAHVEGRMRFPGLVEQAAVWVPRIKAAGADVVVVAAHSGLGPSSSYGDALPYPENAASLVAEQVPGIDAILVGHAHVEVPERLVRNERTGSTVVLTEPLKWGMRLSVIDLELAAGPDGRWQVRDRRARVLRADRVPEDPDVVTLLRPAHEAVLGYVDSVIGTATAPMSTSTARYENSAALGFVATVQGREVRAHLTGEAARLPVLSVVAPYSRSAGLPRGDVRVRDVAGLYLFDDTVLGIRLDGAQLRDYLEWSAAYFRSVPGPGRYRPEELTNAVTATAPAGTPDYNYDVVVGLDAPLAYDIDLSRPPGERIARLTHAGRPVTGGQEFVVAVNHYRQSGGGGFPHVTGATVVDDRRAEVRQLLIDWIEANGTVDPAEFAVTAWRLVAGGEPVEIAPTRRGRRR